MDGVDTSTLIDWPFIEIPSPWAPSELTGIACEEG